MGTVASVNVARVGLLVANDERFSTAILKRAAHERVATADDTLAGDEVGDRVAHGGRDQAVYAYAAEDYEWWQPRTAVAYEPGLFGENLTTRGLDVNAALAGERWRIGSAVFEVTSPRIPCRTLAARMNDSHFVKTFAEALRPGAYCAIVEPGDVGAGDAIEVVYRPAHAITIREMARVWLFDRERLGDLLVPELCDGWRAKVLAKRS